MGDMEQNELRLLRIDEAADMAADAERVERSEAAEDVLWIPEFLRKKASVQTCIAWCYDLPFQKTMLAKDELPVIDVEYIPYKEALFDFRLLPLELDAYLDWLNFRGSWS